MKKKTEFYKKEIQIPNAVGFCKNCFRERRHGSAYCGKCQNEGERMKVYWSNTINFPLLNEVIKKFELNADDLNNLIFTYGDTFFSKNELSYGLIAHEITHTFQQMKTSPEEWWKKYLKDEKFRLSQEVEAYRQQYKVYKMNNDVMPEVMLEKMAQDLSGKIYGNLLSFDEAKKIISIDK
jgi:hypothetical protein